MAKHRKFNVDRFVDKFQGQEELLTAFLARWAGRLEVPAGKTDAPTFKKFLARGDGESMDDLYESLYRAYDLCSERGHEDLVAACRDFPPYDPDPDGKLPVECLSLKVFTENEDAFNLAYDRNTMWKADRFTVYRGQPGKAIEGPRDAVARFRQRLAELFHYDKSSDRVLVRAYQEGSYTNLIVYHEKRTQAPLVFSGSKAALKVVPKILRPAQQDFISYDPTTGQVEVEARFEKEDAELRQAFAQSCLGDADFFEGEGAAKRFNLGAIADRDFQLRTSNEDSASLVELRFRLAQKHGPRLIVRSKDVLETLDFNGLRRRLSADQIESAVIKITFPDDSRGKRVEMSGTNRIKFKRATHAEDVFRYLKDWGILLA